MKRLIFAITLLVVIIGLNFLSERMVNIYCNNVKKSLNNAIDFIEKKDYNSALEYVKKAKDDKSLVPYIYNLDFKKIKKELDDAENLIELKEDGYSKICILRSISLADDIYEEYSFFHRSK